MQTLVVHEKVIARIEKKVEREANENFAKWEKVKSI